ncbi:MAG: AAA family ATPase [Candidatus Dormibacteraeota bacterium]|uniref:Nuclease SbcCD subunit C n=1 Tax=Candidatus Aeolococcus gillhamiae TaxID=3127015 RepID=A0A2W5Z475_9BACT|nr:AAA family ATPase [Candidatus Dormibacteraeota bacterium]PZR77486.1 MAG: hypothetical protein DLM65_15645 [Candidatus Dormibacter sp. RRmetagenome_bin12]
MPDPTLFGLVARQLADHPPKEADAAELVFAAFEGSDTLTAVLSGATASAATKPRTTAPTLAGTFLTSIEVEGFRGIGPPVTLKLPPGPGLTLVVGRNGSGKSSLAEALEMLLTGANQRWVGRPRVWVEGWRNLHQQPPKITASFGVEGRPSTLKVTRTWPDAADVSGSVLTIDGKKTTLAEKGWDEALRRYPPLLSHNELGRILEGKPTDLYDALASILGLADIAAAEGLLRNARLAAERQVKDQQAAATRLTAALQTVDDERAHAVRIALSGKTWDLAAVEKVVAGGLAAVEEHTALRTLRELSTLPVIDRAQVREVTARLREVNDELGRIGGSDAAAARDTAVLLEQALKVHAPHEGLDCPVCGTAGVLTYEWRVQANQRITELRAQASSVDEVHRRAAEIAAQARRLIGSPPPVFGDAPLVGVDVAAADAQWRRWTSPPVGDDPLAFATHLDTVAPDLIAATAAVRSAANAELERREDRWRPMQQQLSAWLPDARAAETQRAQLPRLKAAEAWLKDAHESLRNQRFQPIAGEVQRNWEELRQSSSVQLGDLRLEGTGSSNLRRLTLDVSIDGENGSALGVMSQGELNCLALSLFLPRASMPESPFRFLVIDDPVQAMDPVKVEGLARVLNRVARERQVLVFTHDDRLPDAVRRLEMSATIIEVFRREGSVVELVPVLDPVTRYIDDAMAVAQSKHLPDEARRVVPGFCRNALEAACAEAVTRRMFRDGSTQSEIETVLKEPTKLTTWLALALFNDSTRAGDVMQWLSERMPDAVTVVRLANRGSHDKISGDMVSLVRAAEKLGKRIRETHGASSN